MRVCLTFYRTVAVPLVAITLISVGFVLASGTVLFIFRVFWMKVVTSFLLAAFIVLFRPEQFIFYNNLGYSRTRLLLYVFVFDFFLWIFAMLMSAWMV